MDAIIYISLLLFSIVTQKKRKSSEPVADKRDKKSKRKLKSVAVKDDDKGIDRSNTPPIDSIATTSISEVFTDHVMQKAKETLNVPLATKPKSELNIKKPPPNDAANNDFDIPTISEIAKNAVEHVVRRKEVTELEDLQKKINQAKRQLRQMTDESEDDDCINLRPDKRDLEVIEAAEEASNESEKRAFSRSVKKIISFNQPSEPETESAGVHRPIHDRLGDRPKKENIISLSANRRIEQALYVPGHRRNASRDITSHEFGRTRNTEKEFSKTDRHDRHEDIDDAPRSRRDQNRPVNDLRQKMQSRRSVEEKLDRPSALNRIQPGSNSVSKRIGSRIIVASSRPAIKEVYEKKRDATLNSVVSIQPRPAIPKNKQACKSLLLRAVAEAQKSTAFVQATRDSKLRSSKEENVKIHSREKVSPKPSIIVEVEMNSINDETIDADEQAAGEGLDLTNELDVEDYDLAYEPKLSNDDSDLK